MERNLGIVVGPLLAFAALPLYRSYSDGQVLGRWSYEFTAAMVLVGISWIVFAAWLTRRNRRIMESYVAASLLNLAVVLWGVAYFFAAAESPGTAARLLVGNLGGSTSLFSAFLEWVSLVAVVGVVAVWLWRRRERRWIDAAIGVLAVTALCVFGEGVARLKAFAVPQVQGFPTYSSRIWFERFVQRNKHGFRDREHSLQPSPGVRRILLVGDSYAFGVGIRRVADRLGEQLASLLSRLTGGHWDLINVSRPDVHTLQEEELLRQGLRYRPDYVILLYVFNDIEYLRPPTRGVLGRAQSSVIERLHPVRILYTNSYAFQELFVRVQHVARRLSQNPRVREDPYADDRLVEVHLQDLQRFVSTAEGSGARIAIVPLDIGPGFDDHARRRYLKFVRRAQDAGVPVWSVEAVFAGYSRNALAVNRLDGHPNEFANALAARGVAERIVTEWLDSDSSTQKPAGVPEQELTPP